ncbi:MAG: endo-1,4-beta-xylanase [Cyanobacteria bacterium J06631_6]
MMNKLTRRQLLLYSAFGFSAIASVAAARYRYTDRPQQFAALEIDQLERLRQSDLSLKEKAQEKGIVYGTFPEATDEQAAQDLQFQSYLVRECQLLAAGDVWGVFYPDSLESPYWQNIDYFRQFAFDHQLLFKLDAAVWHEFLPIWLMEKFKDRQTTSTEIAHILRTMVQGVGQRYGAEAYAWSVVNEAINPDDGRDDGFRDTQVSDAMKGGNYPSWLHFLGTNFVELAFEAAAEVAPQTTLIYNDFGLEYDNPRDGKKRLALLKMLERLKAKGTPLHALGIQGHLNASLNQQFNATKYRQFLRDVADLGLKIQVTELDVADNWLPTGLDLAARDRLVAEAYYDFLSVALDEPAVDTVVTWGLSDRYTWLSWFAPREDGSSVRPLPFDAQFNRKLAWSAIAKAFADAPQR